MGGRRPGGSGSRAHERVLVFGMLSLAVVSSLVAVGFSWARLQSGAHPKLVLLPAASAPPASISESPAQRLVQLPPSATSADGRSNNNGQSNNEEGTKAPNTRQPPQNPGNAPTSGDTTKPNSSESQTSQPPTTSQTSQPPFFCITRPGGTRGPECQPSNTGSIAGLTAGPTSPPTSTARPPTVPLPAAPSNLTAVAISSSSIRLRWADTASNESGFEVNNSVKSVHVGPNTTTYIWGGLAPDTYMCFRVRAFNSGGSSGWEPATSPYYKCATTPGTPVPSQQNRPSQASPSPSVPFVTPGPHPSPS
jgi:hypothetical protein